MGGKNCSTCLLCATQSSLRWVKLENKALSSFVYFSLARDNTKTSDRIDRKYTIWDIYLHIREGGKVLGQFEVRKQFLFNNIQNNCT